VLSVAELSEIKVQRLSLARFLRRGIQGQAGCSLRIRSPDSADRRPTLDNSPLLRCCRGGKRGGRRGGGRGAREDEKGDEMER